MSAQNKETSSSSDDSDSDEEEEPTKKPATQPATIPAKPVVAKKENSIKDAVTMLYELFPPPKAPQYKVTSQTGPPNNPTFTMVCTIEDQNFPGSTPKYNKSLQSVLFFTKQIV